MAFGFCCVTAQALALETTVADVHGLAPAAELLHDEETVVYTDGSMI